MRTIIDETNNIRKLMGLPLLNEQNNSNDGYDPTQEALVVGGGDQPAVIFNKKTKRIVRYG